MRTIKLVFLAVFLLSAYQALGQQTSGSLEGTVQDGEGAPIPGAGVSVTSANLQGGRTVFAGAGGRFILPALPVGTYRVSIEFAGYQIVVFEDIRVSLGTNTDLGVIQLAATVYETEDLIVTGRSPLIDPVSTTVGANLRSEEYSDLPLDRSYRNMALLLPHIQQSFLGDEINIGGGTGYENKYYIDGVDVTDVAVGKASTDLPYNFIREIRVRSGGYEAEYRGSLGGVVDVITLSGTNRFQGQAFGFYTNDQLRAEPRQSIEDPSTGNLKMYDVGFSVGGPISQDKLWYLLAYNPAFTSEEIALPGAGIHDNEVTTHRIASKLNWRVNGNNDLELSFFADPTKSEGVGSLPAWLGTPTELANPDPALREATGGGYNIVLNGKHWLGDSFLLESRLSQVTRNDKDIPLTETGADEVLFMDFDTGIWSGGRPASFDNQARIAAAGLAASWFGQRHTVKAGVEYRHQAWDVNDQMEFLGKFDAGGGADVYEEFVTTTMGTIKNRMPSVYLQDSWRLGNSLRLNLGLRWDGQYLVGSDGQVAQTFTDQWQPRLGFTYQPGASGKSQFFGSAGRFYQDLALIAPAALFIEGATYRVTDYDHDPRLDPSGGNVVVDFVSGIHDEADLEGQHFDELTLGYARMMGEQAKFTLRGIYRELKNGLEDAMVDEATGQFEWGNPGYGLLSDFPRMTRIYRALELTLEHAPTDRYNFLVSYVLSANKGNYPGLYPADISSDGWPNMGPAFDVLEQTIDADGLLPNDRTHVFKLLGSYHLTRDFSAGVTASWQSGTPLNEFGAAMADNFYRVFLQPRGTAGGMPSLWDLNLRFAYTVPFWRDSNVEPRLILDWLHIGSQREPVNYDQRSYNSRDAQGNHIDPNPTYLWPVAYQPPMAVRFGFEVGF